MKRMRGFTLLEVIVAFALLALALTLLLGSLSGATRQIRQADDATAASQYSQSLLAQIGVGQYLQPGRSEGQFDQQGRFRWQLDISRYDDPITAAAALRDPGAPELLHLHLTTRWGSEPGQRIVWDTLRLVPPDPNRNRGLP